MVIVNATSSDASGIAKLEFLVNGSVKSTTTSSSAPFSWDTTTLANGAYNLAARATDTAGNVATSATVTVNVQNAPQVVQDTVLPTVAITSPTDGASLGKNTKVNVTSSDNVGVVNVELYVDGKLFSTTTVSNPTFSWNTSKLALGNHTLQAVAYDQAGNAGRSTVVGAVKY